MEYKLDWERIKSFTTNKDKYKYGRRKVTNVLPFQTREPERAKLEKGFMGIVGGVIRKLQGKPLENDGDISFEHVLEQGKYQDKASKALFSHFLKEQRKKLANGEVTTIKQLEQVPLSENMKERKGEKDLIIFVFDVLIGDRAEEVKRILLDINDDDLLTNLLGDLKVDSEENRRDKALSFKCSFPKLRDQFIQDLAILAQNERYMLAHIETLFVHYTFVALTQLILQTNKRTKFSEEQFIPVYYLMKWEKAAKWRDAYDYGNRMLEGEIDGFFAHEHILNIIGMNTFTSEENLFYHDIEKILDEAGPDARTEFIQSIYDWLNNDYGVRTGTETATYQTDKTLDDAFKDMYRTIKPNIYKEVHKRTSLSYKIIISRFFRKHGGLLGTFVSLSQAQLLPLIAVSVGNERMELKQLWLELEKRGIWFDYYSKEEVIHLLDELNYLEKKSDSGDAQYVKSIL